MGQLVQVTHRMQTLTRLAVLVAVCSVATASSIARSANHDVYYRTVPTVFSVIYDAGVELATYLYDTVIGGAKWPFDITIALMDVVTARYPDIGALALAVMQHFVDNVGAESTATLGFYQKVFEIYYNMMVRLINLVVAYPAPLLEA